MIPRDQFEQIMRRCLGEYETVESMLETIAELETEAIYEMDHAELRYKSGLYSLRFWDQTVQWRDISFIAGTLKQLYGRHREYTAMIADRSIYEINYMGQVAGTKAGTPGIHVSRKAAEIIRRWDHASDIREAIVQLEADYRLQIEKLQKIRTLMKDPLLKNKE